MSSRVRAELAGRSLVRWGSVQHEFESVDDFEQSEICFNAVHSVWIERSVIDVLLLGKNGRPLVVFFNGAATGRQSIKLPIFRGMTILKQCDVSLLAINDPTLYLSDSLTLGWYAGHKGGSVQNDILRVISKIARDSQPTRVLFTGGSGGGFASLYFSSFFPGSLAVAWNPQTDIFSYVPSHVREYLATAWGVTSYEEARGQIEGIATFDVLGRYAKGQHDNYVVYLQNESDWHVAKHLHPFLRNYGVATGTSGIISDRLLVRMSLFGDGHVAPGKDFLEEMYRSLALREVTDWRELFSSGQILECLPVD